MPIHYVDSKANPIPENGAFYKDTHEKYYFVKMDKQSLVIVDQEAREIKFSRLIDLANFSIGLCRTTPTRSPNTLRRYVEFRYPKAMWPNLP